MREGTLKQLNVKVGDKVRPLVNPRGYTIQGGQLMLITSVNFNYGWCMGRNINKPWGENIRLSDQIIFRLEEEAVEEIKVGDTVEVNRPDIGWKGGYTVLAIQDKDKNVHRHWIVVAFMGDIPQVFTPDKVRKPKPKPVVKEVVINGGATAGVWGFDSILSPCVEDTHKITFNLVDGEPDCNSIKMFKL